jgi:hypothetical protein
MKLGKACIPLGGAWSSPFVLWHGAIADLSSLGRSGTPRSPQRRRSRRVSAAPGEGANLKGLAEYRETSVAMIERSYGRSSDTTSWLG